jgi:hypothetical protein
LRRALAHARSRQRHQHHNNATRDGLFIDPAFTPAAAASIARDPNFDGTIVGNVYAQPLYVEGGPDNRAKVIVATASNNVYALDAITGAIIWQRNVGTPITSGLPCGNYGSTTSPAGIISTPVLDLASRSVFVNAEVSGSGHRVFSLNVDTGAINPGWPVTMNAAVSGFDSSVQSQRSALGLANGVLYVPYGGRFGDCGSYRGRLVGIPLDATQPIASYTTGSTRAGIWAVGGVASDGTNLYVATGNGSGAVWAGNEAVIRLQPGPVFSNNSADFWAPTNWMALDSADADLGGSAPVLFDVPGANPSALILQTGKDRNAYLINRANMGGVVYTCRAGGHFHRHRDQCARGLSHRHQHLLRGPGGHRDTERLSRQRRQPAHHQHAWSVSSAGRTSPFRHDDFAEQQRNRVGVRHRDRRAPLRLQRRYRRSHLQWRRRDRYLQRHAHFNTGIAARGRIYLAGDNKVTAFKVPFNPPVPASAVSRKTHGSAGDFDIPLPLTGTPGIECRSGGATNDFTLVISFAADVAVTGDTQAEISSGTAQIGSGGVPNNGAVTVTGNTITVPLTNVGNAQTINVRLNGVTDGVGYGDIVVPMSRLLGDVTPNGGRYRERCGRNESRGRPTDHHRELSCGRGRNRRDQRDRHSVVKSATGSSLPANATEAR